MLHTLDSIPVGQSAQRTSPVPTRKSWRGGRGVHHVNVSINSLLVYRTYATSTTATFVCNDNESMNDKVLRYFFHSYTPSCSVTCSTIVCGGRWSAHLCCPCETDSEREFIEEWRAVHCDVDQQACLSSSHFGLR